MLNTQGVMGVKLHYYCVIAIVPSVENEKIANVI